MQGRAFRCQIKQSVLWNGKTTFNGINLWNKYYNHRTSSNLRISNLLIIFLKRLNFSYSHVGWYICYNVIDTMFQPSTLWSSAGDLLIWDICWLLWYFLFQTIVLLFVDVIISIMFQPINLWSFDFIKIMIMKIFVLLLLKKIC